MEADSSYPIAVLTFIYILDCLGHSKEQTKILSRENHHKQAMLSTSAQTTELLKIGELKARSGISVKTIRYYEQLGLIEAEKRTEGGFRLFTPEAIARLAFIKRSQSLGLSLQEIGEILHVHDQGKLPCQEVRHKLQAKVKDIEQRIEELQLLKTQLKSLIDTPKDISTNPAKDIICPIIQQN